MPLPYISFNTTKDKPSNLVRVSFLILSFLASTLPDSGHRHSAVKKSSFRVDQQACERE